jgi:hypothetical protein
LLSGLWVPPWLLASSTTLEIGNQELREAVGEREQNVGDVVAGDVMHVHTGELRR